MTGRDPRPDFAAPDPGIRTTFREYVAEGGVRMVAFATDDDVCATMTDDEIGRTLRRIREKFDGLALYGSGRHAARVLRIAVELNYRGVLLTVWDLRSPIELCRAARLVRAYDRRLTLAVALGCEGLLLGRYTLADLRRARAVFRWLTRPIPVELASTEPWSFYLDRQRRDLVSGFDFLVPNIHGIWDTQIVDPQEMARWTVDRAAALAEATGRVVLVREAGLPGAGMAPRLPAGLFVFDRASQAAFWRVWLDLRACGEACPAVAFEAVDNLTKTYWNSFEAHWGLLAPDRVRTGWPAWHVFPAIPPAGE